MSLIEFMHTKNLQHEKHIHDCEKSSSSSSFLYLLFIISLILIIFSHCLSVTMMRIWWRLGGWWKRERDEERMNPGSKDASAAVKDANEVTWSSSSLLTLHPFLPLSFRNFFENIQLSRSPSSALSSYLLLLAVNSFFVSGQFSLSLLKEIFPEQEGEREKRETKKEKRREKDNSSLNMLSIFLSDVDSLVMMMSLDSFLETWSPFLSSFFPLNCFLYMCESNNFTFKCHPDEFIKTREFIMSLSFKKVISFFPSSSFFSKSSEGRKRKIMKKDERKIKRKKSRPKRDEKVVC